MGHVQTQLLLGGRGPWPAILLMSLSFALIHGVFFPDKVAITFLLGLITGWYYQREHNLLPLIVAHVVLDLRSLGLTILG